MARDDDRAAASPLDRRRFLRLAGATVLGLDGLLPAWAGKPGSAEAGLSLRLRHEIRREFAPYLGLSWSRRYGATADLGRTEGRDAVDTAVVAGLRLWF